MKNDSFVNQFIGISDMVNLTSATADENTVQVITGATISSKAVVKIINNVNTRWLSKLPQAGAEPKLQATETKAGRQTRDD